MPKLDILMNSWHSCTNSSQYSRPTQDLLTNMELLRRAVFLLYEKLEHVQADLLDAETKLKRLKPDAFKPKKKVEDKPNTD